MDIFVQSQLKYTGCTVSGEIYFIRTPVINLSHMRALRKTLHIHTLFIRFVAQVRSTDKVLQS